jgi:hypothetical protein
VNRLREIIDVSLTVTSVVAVLLFAASLSAGVSCRACGPSAMSKGRT